MMRVKGENGNKEVAMYSLGSPEALTQFLH